MLGYRSKSRSMEKLITCIELSLVGGGLIGMVVGGLLLLLRGVITMLSNTVITDDVVMAVMATAFIIGFVFMTFLFIKNERREE